MTKPLVIYHADCTDGYGAAFAAWMKLGDEAEYLPMNYNSINPADLADLTDDREVYTLDFSLPRVQMDSLFANAKRVVWLDHHKTAFEMWCGKAPDLFFTIHKEADDQKHIVLDDCKSGALLAWEYFHPGTEVPMLIQHIDDRDRWQWKLDGSAEIHAALSSMKPWSFERWSSLLYRDIDGVIIQRGLQPLFNEGTAILRAQKQHVEQMAKQARKCTISIVCCIVDVPEGETYDVVKLSGLAVNASLHQSEVGHELANQSGTYGLVFYLASDGRVRCSLRSNGEYDVSAIARAFGGGGHRNAAGFETDIETLINWLK